MEKDWITVYQTNKTYQAELRKKHLDEAGLTSVIIDKTDSSYVGIFDSYGSVELKVRKEDEQKALEILKEYNE